MKPPRDHIRLLRAFEIPPTRYGVAAWSTGILGLIGTAAPVMLVPAGLVVAGVGGMSFTDRRAIAKGLREVLAFGFPVIGYRAWILAEQPTFDLELARDVDLEVVRTSSAAIDPSIVVDKKGPRIFRFVMRRIALPNVKMHMTPIEVGDRRLLKELHRRILAPLHADVGIRQMRMGDILMQPPVAGPAEEEPLPDVIGLGVFRESALAAPPALQALVHVGGERAMPHEARRLRQRAERVMHAANSSPSGFGTVAAITFGGTATGGQFGLPGIWVGMAGGLVAGIATVVTGNRQNARSVARAVANQGYPIEDYDDWLLSGRPLMDIETVQPIERAWLHEQLARLTAWSVTKNTHVAWVEDVVWFAPTEVRIETRPSYVQPPTSRIQPFYGGSHDMFRRFLIEVLAIVHRQYQITSVKMGGYIDRRV